MDEQELIRAATEARERAYAPYSGFRVGAAAMASDGSIFTGCNVENSVYGLTICAERAAVFAAVAAGKREISALAVVTDTDPPAAPCGACRQVLTEFGSGATVIAANPAGEIRTWKLKELLPDRPFSGKF